MKQVLKVAHNGRKFVVIYHEGEKVNPYRVYELRWEPTEYGYCTERRRLVTKYQTLDSALLMLAGVEEFRREK